MGGRNLVKREGLKIHPIYSPSLPNNRVYNIRGGGVILQHPSLHPFASQVEPRTLRHPKVGRGGIATGDRERKEISTLIGRVRSY